MLISTTSTLEGKRIKQYLGLVSGDAILGANIFKDFFAGIRDIVGGRSAAYENELRRAKEIAMREMQDQAAAMGRMAPEHHNFSGAVAWCERIGGRDERAGANRRAFRRAFPPRGGVALLALEHGGNRTPLIVVWITSTAQIEEQSSGLSACTDNAPTSSRDTPR